MYKRQCENSICNISKHYNVDELWRESGDKSSFCVDFFGRFAKTWRNGAGAKDRFLTDETNKFESFADKDDQLYKQLDRVVRLVEYIDYSQAGRADETNDQVVYRYEYKDEEQRRQNIADKRMELQKAQEARQAQRKADGSATTGATRPHERPATASTISKPSAEKTQEVKRPATATTSKASEPVKTNVIKERPLSSGASDRKATQPTQTVHRQNVEKVVSQETRQNYIKDRRTKVQQTQSVQKNQQTTEKTRNLVTKKGQKKK